ncbi:MAG TPA: hypothetical protein VNS19_01885 [Acidimicrobiales bacterium]|nr:hypothetical protein [Acidimicrobiales bacterium]
MTDPHPLTDDDLSLALDGEADAQLLARIDADPAAQARLEELRAAAQLSGAPVPPLDDDVVDDLIARAIDTPVAPVVTGTRRSSRRAAPWLVAASVVLLMAVGLSLVWAGRSSDDDQASAARDATEAAADTSGAGSAADSSFSESADTGSAAADGVAGGHGSPTTVAPSTSSASVPLLYLGSYASGDDLRAATADSFTDAWKDNGELTFDDPDTESDRTQGRSMADPPSSASVDRCADQLQITLSMEGAPVQSGYATVDGKDVLVYEFATASAKDADRETTLVAAVGADACDEVVFFER